MVSSGRSALQQPLHTPRAASGCPADHLASSLTFTVAVLVVVRQAVLITNTVFSSSHSVCVCVCWGRGGDPSFCSQTVVGI